MNGTAKVIQATNKEIRPEYLQTSLMMKHDKDNKILGLNFLIKVIDFIFILYLCHIYYKPEAAIYIAHPFWNIHQAEVRAFYVCLEEISHECQE